jgi:RNA polymerase sigma-70 factor (family 1)
MLKSLTDKALLKAADEQFAFRVLYDRYWQSLYIKAYRRLHSEEDAQDVVQCVFISLWRNRRQVQVEESLAPYLFTALKYAVIKVVYKKSQKGTLLPLSIAELEKFVTANATELEYKELKANIENEVAALPERMREIYQLSRVKHMRNAEIAQMLNISEQTVKNTISVTLKRLKSKLLHLFLAMLAFLFL